MNKNSTIKKMIITALSISLMSMSGMIISPALNNIELYFNTIDPVYIQMLITIPSLFMIPTTLLSDKVIQKFSYKQVYLFCLIVLMCFGSLPLFSKNFIFIFISRMFVGLSIGLLTPINTAMLTTYLSEEIKPKMLGINSAVESFGGALMVIVSGFLANISWDLCFLTYILSLIPIVLVIFIFDESFNTYQTFNKEKVKLSFNKQVMLYTFFICVYMTFFNVYSTKLSTLIIERQFGNTLTSGVATGAFYVFSFLSGMVFDKINSYFKKHTFSISVLLSALGIFMLTISYNQTILVLSSVVCGFSMGILIPAAMNIASFYSTRKQQTFSISLVLSGSRIGQFFTTLIYLPIASSFNLTTGHTYTFACVGLIILFLLAFCIEKTSKPLH